MKKSIFLLMAFICVVTHCNHKKQAEFTILPDYVYYYYIPELLNGKVDRVTEKYYGFIPDGVTIRKGGVTIKKSDSLTAYELDSLYCDNIIESTFDSSGDIKSIMFLDESNQVISGWEFSKENNLLTLAKEINNDTVSRYDKLKCNSDGTIIEVSRFRAVVDTLISSYTYEFSLDGDTETRQNYDFRGIPSQKTISVVHHNGQYLNVAHYDKNGVYTNGMEFKYNEKGDCVEWANYYGKDKKASSGWILTDIDYDNYGNWIMKIIKASHGMNGVYLRTYTYFNNL